MLEQTLKFLRNLADTRKLYQLDAGRRGEGSEKTTMPTGIPELHEAGRLNQRPEDPHHCQLHFSMTIFPPCRLSSTLI